MSLIQAKQVNKKLSAPIEITGFTANGANDIITTVITTALTTAGAGSVAVPLQVSSDDFTMGVATSGSICPIADATTKDPIEEGGYAIYGRLTETAGVYTLTYFYDADGTETAHTFSGDTDIDFNFCYVFDFARFPTKALCAITSRSIRDDVTGEAGRPFDEILTPTGTNTLPALTNTPTATTPRFLLVNGKIENDLSGGAFSVSGVSVTWNATNAGYDIETTDSVVAFYWTRD